jgi:chromosome segregation ATPase
MAIEIDTSRVATQTAALATQTNAPAEQGTTVAPLLGGKSLTVSSGAMSDLDKLVAKIKNENENTRQSVAQRRISILQTVLDSMADSITATEKENLLEIEKLNGQKSTAESELSKLQGEKTATEGRITALDIQIDALEKAIEQAVQDGADHREQVAKLKKQREEDQAELNQIEGNIKTVSSKIVEIDGKIAKCTETIGAATLSKVTEALRAASSEDGAGEAERPETQADRDKKDAKEVATDISRHIR